MDFPLGAVFSAVIIFIALCAGYLKDVSQSALVMISVLGIIVFAIICEARYLSKQIINISNKLSDVLTAVATLLLAFVTAGLVVISYFQWTTSKNDQRPWVGINSVQSSDSLIPPDSIHMRLNITNSGKSPAINVFVGVEDWRKDFHSIVFPTAKYDTTCRINGMELLPNGGVYIDIPSSNDEIFARIGDTILIVVRIDFDDTDGVPHKTGLCMTYTNHLTNIKTVRGLPVVAGTELTCNTPTSNYAD